MSNVGEGLYPEKFVDVICEWPRGKMQLATARNARPPTPVSSSLRHSFKSMGLANSAPSLSTIASEKMEKTKPLDMVKLRDSATPLQPFAEMTLCYDAWSNTDITLRTLTCCCGALGDHGTSRVRRRTGNQTTTTTRRWTKTSTRSVVFLDPGSKQRQMPRDARRDVLLRQCRRSSWPIAEAAAAWRLGNCSRIFRGRF